MSFGIYLDWYGSGGGDRKAFREALARWGWDGSRDSPYQIGTADGITVELYASTLIGRTKPFAGGNLEVRGFSVELCRLVLDLARAGGFSISHDAESDAIILTGEERRTDLPADMADHPKIMVCQTPEELEAAIQGGFDVWRKYRNRVGSPGTELEFAL